MVTPLQRCAWVTADPVYQQYHDIEWGVPVHDDQRLFEFLVLETFQAGLSWLTVLKKRENFRRAFDSFDPERIVLYTDEKTTELLNDAGIIRNRLKVQAAVSNARAFLKVQEQYGSFDSYIWGFVDGVPLINHWQAKSQVPASTALSDALSKDLRQRGFKFVGSTVAYAYMQATGMVMDHTLDCFRYGQLSQGALRR